MAGLLDFVQTPEGQGLLSAAFGGLATAGRRGTGTLNTIGAAGLSGLQGYASAQDNQLRRQDQDLNNQILGLQINKLKQQQSDADALRGFDFSKFYLTPEQQAASAYGGPTQAAAAAAKNFQPKFDNQAMMQALITSGNPALMQQGFGMLTKENTPIKLGKNEQMFVRNADGTYRSVAGNSVPDLQYVQGDDYRPPVIFNKDTGAVSNAPMPGSSAQQSQQPSASYPSGQYIGLTSTTPITNSPRAPWDGMPPKQADDMKRSIYEQESKKLDALRTSIATGQKTMTMLNRFGDLNQQVSTGSIADKILPDTMSFTPQKQEMVSIQNALAPQMRPTGSGSSSDTDVRMFKSGLPSIDKTGDVNRNIRMNYQNLLDQDKKELAFKEAYLAQYGHLNGADQAFQASLQGGSSAAPRQQAAQPAQIEITPNGKLLTGDRRDALNRIIQSGNPQYIEQARQKGWIK